MPEETRQARPLRTGDCRLQVSSVAVWIGLCFKTAGFERIDERMEIHDLPLPTESSLRPEPVERSPVGLGLALIGLATLILLAQKGVLDRHLKRLMGANALLFLLGFPFRVLSVFMPLLRIQKDLSK